MASLKFSDHGIEVMKIQLLLNSLVQPSPRLSLSGHFDHHTYKAVMAFQKSKGLPTDGIVNTSTRSALGLKVTQLINPPVFLKSEAPWLNIAQAEKSLMEESKPNLHSARIVEYQKTIINKDSADEVLWCSAFINWVMAQVKRNGTNSAMAKSWLKWGMPAIHPARGDIVVLRIKNAAATAGVSANWGYHVGFYLSSTPRHVRLLGGNQSYQVTEANFSLKEYDVVGYRRPI